MKNLGNPEQFDNESECPETSWGQKFRNTRLVFRKKDGELEFHTYGGDYRPHTFISQIKRADKDVVFGDFDYVRLYTTDNNPGYDMVESSPEPVFSQCQIDESSYCLKDFKLKQFHPDLIICPDFQFSSWLSFDYESYVQKIRKSALDTPSIKKVCWRGLARPQHRFYKTFIEECLNPFEHYIPIKYDFSDLIEKIKWAEDNPKESEAINENMFEFCSSNLSVRAINKKWKELLNDQSQV